MRIVTLLEQTNDRLDSLNADWPPLLIFEDIFKMVKRQEIPTEKRHGRWIISREAWDRAHRKHFDTPQAVGPPHPHRSAASLLPVAPASPFPQPIPDSFKITRGITARQKDGWW